MSWRAAIWLLWTTEPMAVHTWDRWTEPFSFDTGSIPPSSTQTQLHGWLHISTTRLYSAVHVGKYRTENKLKKYRLNTTQKSKQCKTQQNETTLDQSPFTTLGQEMRWAYSTVLPSPHWAAFSMQWAPHVTQVQCVMICRQKLISYKLFTSNRKSSSFFSDVVKGQTNIVRYITGFIMPMSDTYISSSVQHLTRQYSAYSVRSLGWWMLTQGEREMWSWVKDMTLTLGRQRGDTLASPVDVHRRGQRTPGQQTLSTSFHWHSNNRHVLIRFCLIYG